MPETITQKQLAELMWAERTNPEKFIKLMAFYTGITAKKCVAYQFFDSAGDFIGDNWDDDLLSILTTTGIEVVEDG
jgi:hypothetical protein